MIAIKASLVVGIACVAAALMRQCSAAARHALLAGAIACAGLMPVLESIAPAWGSEMPAVIAPAAIRGTFDVVRSVWIGGVAIAAAILAAGLVGLARTRAKARESHDQRQLAMLMSLADELGIPRRIRLFESAHAVNPSTWGVRRPVIIIPATAREWSDDRLRAVLSHELAHVRRADWAVNLAAELIACLWWCSPVIWWARRQLRRDSERAADDIVMNLGADGPDYAAHLLSVAREVRGAAGGVGAAAAMAGHGRAGSLERRVRAVLNRDVNRTPLHASTGVATAALLAVCSVPIAGYGVPAAPFAPRRAALLDVQRDIMMRLGGEERRFSIVSGDVSFWKNRLEGRVELQARLNVDGSVSGVRVVEPAHPDLAAAAEVIVRQWRREPARVRGVPVEVPIRMTINFKR